MSSDIQWQILRAHNASLVKRDGILLSREPGNLLNVHSYKHSGLANGNTVHVGAGKDKKISLTIRRAKDVRHPSSGSVLTPLNKHRRDRSIRAAHVINNATQRAYHRRDLTKYAIARYHALYRASKVKEGSGVNAKRRRAGSKATKATAAAAATA